VTGLLAIIPPRNSRFQTVRNPMKHRTLPFVALAAAFISLSGCVVAPARHAAVVEAVPVYVAPTYERPGVGWVWEYHPHYGWGWHHPLHGWHKG
jgi:hypothetical protein